MIVVILIIFVELSYSSSYLLHCLNSKDIYMASDRLRLYILDMIIRSSVKNVNSIFIS